MVSSHEAGVKACGGLRAYIAERGVMQHSDAGPQSVAVIGDSYAAGDGLEDRTDAWAYSIGRTISGVGSTGFVNGGYCGTDSYATRIGQVISAAPDTLIIQGGLNDTTAGRDAVRKAASDVLGKASAVRRVIVVGPADVPKRDGEADVDVALAEAASSAGREYVSMLGFSGEYLPDGVHLTAAAHDRFAEVVAAAIKD
jgi:lysophospholipase L1-like esterase